MTTFVSATSATAVENNKYVEFVVSLCGPSADSVSVKYLAFLGSGESAHYLDNDYVEHEGTLVFAAGETSKTVRIEVVDDSQLFVKTKSFALGLFSPINAVLGDCVVVGTINALGHFRPSAPSLYHNGA
jgi:hypothetical protein